MVAVNYNFPIEKGSDFQINFIYNDENNNQNIKNLSFKNLKLSKIIINFYLKILSY